MKLITFLCHFKQFFCEFIMRKMSIVMTTSLLSSCPGPNLFEVGAIPDIHYSQRYNYKFIATGKGKDLLMYEGYTYSQSRDSNNFYCSRKNSQCRVRVKLGTNGQILDIKDVHNHPPPTYVMTATGYHVKIGIMTYKFIPTNINPGKYLLMMNNYTFSQSNKTLNYYCSKKDSGCKARVKLNKDGVIVCYNDTHNHDPPRYVVTKTGSYVKLGSMPYKFIPTNKNPGKYLLMMNKYTYSQKNETLLYYCSKKDAGCKARVKLDTCGVIVDYYDIHIHDPPKYMVTPSGRKRSYLWRFFEEVDSNTTRCKLCQQNMSRNMSRHLRVKHPEYSQKVPRLPKQTDKNREIKPWVAPAWVKKYCQKIDDKKYKCVMCDRELRMPHGLYGNLKRHIKNKHPFAFHEEKSFGQKPSSGNDTDDCLEEYIQKARKAIDERRKSNIDSEDIEYVDTAVSHEEVVEADIEEHLDNNDQVDYLSETEPDYEEKIKFLCGKPIFGKKRAINPIWNFFNIIKLNKIYSCMACQKTLSIFPHSAGNLKRHIKTKHRKQYQIMMRHIAELNRMPLTLDKYFFSSATDGQFKCKGCGDVVLCQDDDQQLLFQHIKEKHLASLQDDQSDDDEYSIVIIKKKDMELDAVDNV